MTYPQTPVAAPQQPAVAPAKTNTLAIVSIIVVWFVSLLGVILGHIALSQIKRTGEGGRGIALAAVIIGYVAIGLAILLIIFAIIVGAASASVSTYSY
ncbi:DUF4190 domain-containing protein [Rathayibacter sp. CAU 1779]